MHLRTQQNVTVTVHHGTDTNELFVLKKTGQLVTKEFMFNGLSEADCDSVESVVARMRGELHCKITSMTYYRMSELERARSSTDLSRSVLVYKK